MVCEATWRPANSHSHGQIDCQYRLTIRLRDQSTAASLRHLGAAFVFGGIISAIECYDDLAVGTHFEKQTQFRSPRRCSLVRIMETTCETESILSSSVWRYRCRFARLDSQRLLTCHNPAQSFSGYAHVAASAECASRANGCTNFHSIGIAVAGKPAHDTNFKSKPPL